MPLEDVLLKLSQTIEANTAAILSINRVFNTTHEPPTEGQAAPAKVAEAKAKKGEVIKVEIKAKESESVKEKEEAKAAAPDSASVKMAFVNLLDIDRAAGVAILASFNAAKLAEVTAASIADFYGAVLAKTAELSSPTVVAEEDILG